MRIIVATDGSACADTAVDLAAGIDWPAGSSIHVVQAIDIGGAIFGSPWGPMPALDTETVDEAARDFAGDHIAGCRERLAAPGRTVDGGIEEGRAADVIVTRAGELEADLIIMGSRGHGRIETMLLGSVSSEVIDHAPCPVLIARGVGTERILLAWDGSACASAAAALLTDWPVLRASSVSVVCVADIVPTWTAVSDTNIAAGVIDTYDEGARASVDEHLRLAEEMASRLRSAGLAAEPEQRSGDPATEIVAAAKAAKSDLIVIGTHGVTGLRRLLLGSVARNVLHHAECSVLVTRERDEADAEADRR